MYKNIIFDLGNVVLNYNPEEYLIKKINDKNKVEIALNNIFKSNEWKMLDRGIITEEEAKTHPRRNHITRAIGTDEMVIVDIFKKQIDAGNKILLTSDGLTGFVDDNTIKDTLLKDEDVNDLTKELINTANDVSGRDNISVILIEEK